jgi:hypothetical protein
MIRTNSTGMFRMIIGDAFFFYPQLFPVGYISYNPLCLKYSGMNPTDTFGVRVQRNISPPVSDSQRVINAIWTITEDNPGGADITLGFGYNSSQFGSMFQNNANTVFIGRHHNGVWNLTPCSDIDSSGYFQFIIRHNAQYMAIAEGFNGFSPFSIGNEEALPVNMEYFNYTTSKNDVKLSWKTLTEINNSGFEIERRVPQSSQWSKIGAKAGFGNSAEPHIYIFDDRNLNTGKYIYRLRQIDYNSNTEYYYLSDTVIVGKPSHFGISQNYPNPFNPLTKIDFDLPIDGKVTIKIYDVTGREVMTIVNNEFKQAGYYTVDFNGSFLASGIYFYRLTAESYTNVKKMVLIK